MRRFFKKLFSWFFFCDFEDSSTNNVKKETSFSIFYISWTINECRSREECLFSHDSILLVADVYRTAVAITGCNVKWARGEVGIYVETQCTKLEAAGRGPYRYTRVSASCTSTVIPTSPREDAESKDASWNFIFSRENQRVRGSHKNINQRVSWWISNGKKKSINYLTIHCEALWMSKSNIK